MPLYEFKCECGNKKETILSYQEYAQPQICECGETMERKISLSTIGVGTELLYTRDGKAAFGRQMALDTINSKDGGFPDVNKHKSWVQKTAFAGI